MATCRLPAVHWRSPCHAPTPPPPSAGREGAPGGRHLCATGVRGGGEAQGAAAGGGMTLGRCPSTCGSWWPDTTMTASLPLGAPAAPTQLLSHIANRVTMRSTSACNVSASKAALRQWALQDTVGGQAAGRRAAAINRRERAGERESGGKSVRQDGDRVQCFLGPQQAEYV